MPFFVLPLRLNFLRRSALLRSNFSRASTESARFLMLYRSNTERVRQPLIAMITPSLTPVIRRLRAAVLFKSWKS